MALQFSTRVSIPNTLNNIAEAQTGLGDASDYFDPGQEARRAEGGGCCTVLIETTSAPETNAVGFAALHQRGTGRVDAVIATRKTPSDPAKEGTSPVGPASPANSAAANSESAACDALISWVVDEASDLAAQRKQDELLVVTFVAPTDHVRKSALSRAGFSYARPWFIMQRPTASNLEYSIPPNVRIRRVETDQDRQASHRVLEDAFLDHFASFPETFAEFDSRAGFFTGHSWNRNYIAELRANQSETWTTAGCLITSREASGSVAHAEYLGVCPHGRHCGIGRALLGVFNADARSEGFRAIELLVDAESLTAAQTTYVHLGFATVRRVETWHRTVRP